MAKESPIRDADNLFAGETKGLQFTVKDDADVVVDITGWALSWTLRDNPDSAAKLVEKTTAGGGIAITNGPGGVCVVTVDAADTSGLTEGRYSYTLRRTDSGFESVLAFGDVALQKGA